MVFICFYLHPIQTELFFSFAQNPVTGSRFRCTQCDDYDLCARCFAKVHDIHAKTHVFIEVCLPTPLTLVTTQFRLPCLYDSTQRLSWNKGKRHSAICDGCERNVVGVRYKCAQCKDFGMFLVCVFCLLMFVVQISVRPVTKRQARTTKRTCSSSFSFRCRSLRSGPA